MKKALLIFGTLFFLLMTSYSYAQRNPRSMNKRNATLKSTKTDKKKEETPEIKNNLLLINYGIPTPEVLLIDKAPKMKIDPERLKSYQKLILNIDKSRREFRTIGSGFKTGDYSTSSNSPGKKTKNQFCTITKLNTNLNTDSFKDFTDNGPPDWLKPGIILNAEGFVKGKDLIEENYNRGPIKISTTAPGAPQAVAVVNNPKERSSITNALRKLLSTDNTVRYGANMTYSYSEIHSFDELNLTINGRYSNAFGRIASALDWDSTTNKTYHYYLVEFQQSIFNLEVDGLDKNNIFPENRDIDLSQYVYISKVNYGRKGYFMFKTEENLANYDINANVSANFLGNKARIRSNLQKISTSSNIEVRAFYYGGTGSSVVTDISADWNREGRKPLEDYIAGYQFSASEAYPISYELKNLDNERVGMNSKNSETIETCIATGDINLKVTLVELQCATTSDDDNIADYGITQHIQYIANNEVIIPFKSDYSGDNCRPGDERYYWLDFTPLICGNIDKQIGVRVSKKIDHIRSPNIDSSIVFKITPEQAKDKTAELLIYTWVKEYSSNLIRRNDIVMNDDPQLIKVAIHDVIAILKGIRTINYKGPHHDDAISKELKFDIFEGTTLALTQIDSPGKPILEGPIRARGKDEKAFVWMRFQIVD